MKNYEPFLNLSPFVVDALEKAEARTKSIGRPVEIEICSIVEARRRKDPLLHVSIVDPATPTRKHLGTIPCRVSALATVAVSLYLLADALAPDGNAARAAAIA